MGEARAELGDEGGVPVVMCDEAVPVGGVPMAAAGSPLSLSTKSDKLCPPSFPYISLRLLSLLCER